MRQSKYTKELLDPIAAGSISVAEVLRKLGLRATAETTAWCRPGSGFSALRPNTLKVRDGLKAKTGCHTGRSLT